jgi:hypothetical protein
MDPRFDSIRTGDVALTATTSMVGFVITAGLLNTIQHCGIFVWRNRSRRIVIGPDHELCLLHCQNGTHKCVLCNMIHSNTILEPVMDIIPRGYTIYHRPLHHLINRNEIVIKTEHFMSKHLEYEYVTNLHRVLAVAIGREPTETNPTKGFLCTHFVASYLINVVGYPWGPFNPWEIAPNGLIIPKRHESIWRPADLMSSFNQSPIFEDGPERLIVKQFKASEISFRNPIIAIVILLIVLSIILLIMIFRHYRSCSLNMRRLRVAMR